ncbi:MAG: Crp/Fnr family transcriptional regulator [Patescibacteria group bacterium]
MTESAIDAEQKIEIFFKKCPEKTYKKGDLVIENSTKRPEFIYYIQKGYVGQMKKNNSPGNIITLNILKKKSYFPIILALGDLENQYDFKAFSDVKVRVAPVADVIAFLKANADVLFSLTSRLSQGVGGLLNHLETLMIKEASDQILDTLTVYAKRFGQKEGKYFKIDLELTHKNLAGVLGLTRETVTRELKELIKNREIIRKGKYFYIALAN